MEDVEVGVRREAVRRRLAGESPEVIARELGRTRQWVRKWTARYDPDDPGWALGRSHAARRVANRTVVEVEARVLAVRAKLEANPWAQVGAPAVAWELEKLGAVVPPLRTIERILERAGATGRPRAGRRASKGIPYPAAAARRSGDVVQVDLVGPRHLDGGVRFHALNQIDVCSHHAGIEIVADRGDQRVIAALHAIWSRHGVPGRVQFDNGGPFTSPTGVGEVVRFACTSRQRRCSSRPASHGATAPSSASTTPSTSASFARSASPTATSSPSAPARSRPSTTASTATGQPTGGRPTRPRRFRGVIRCPSKRSRPAGRRPAGSSSSASSVPITSCGCWEIQLPDGHAYQYLTATLDLSIANGTDNLLVCDEHGELITTTHLAGPRR